MRHCCRQCNSTDTALQFVEEGWDAEGPRGIHIQKRRYCCRSCGHEWTERTKPADAGRAEA